ncbi:MAG: hypothetical protein JSR89_18465 [Proteobacteria bacterium]|nr:hypothetical protein [Pseudomonadota bacterium]
MGISVVGILVCFGLLAIGWCLGSPLLIGLLASLPFGSTAIGTIGNSTPLLFTIFEIMLVVLIAVRPAALRSLVFVVKEHWSSWVVIALGVYVVGCAVFMPRLFAGRVAVPGVVGGYSADVLLQPVPGNFNQASYFAMGMLTFFALSVYLLNLHNLTFVRRGFFAFAGINAALGIFDLLGKVAGVSDILSPIRTAAYTMHTDSSVAGFWRIAGGHTEAAAFAGSALASAAFCLSYWRSTGSRLALWLMLALGALLVLSTSSTAYGSIAILSVFLGAAIICSSVENGLRKRDAALVGIAAACAIIILFVAVINPSIFGSFFDLIYGSIFEKAGSSSGVERAYWNSRSLDAFVATYGLGIGIGSSRASSWVVAVLSQLGVVGFALITVLTIVLIRGMHGVGKGRSENEVTAIANAVRAAAIASLVANSLIGGGADPGLIFIIAAAVIIQSRTIASRRAGSAASPTPADTHFGSGAITMAG